MILDLRYLIPLVLLLFAVLAGALTFAYNGVAAARHAEADMHEALLWQMNRLQSTAERLLRTNDLERLREEIASLGSDPSVLNAVLVDDANNVVAALQRIEIGRQIDQVLPSRPAQQLVARAERMTRVRHTLIGEVSLRPDRMTMRAVYPVQMADEALTLRPTRVGLLYMLYDLTAAKMAARRQVEAQVLQYSGALLALAALLGVFLHHVVARRLHFLTTSAQRFAAGDAQVRSGVGGRDEIARLANSFDDVMQTVAAGQQALASSEYRYRMLFESGSDALFVSDIGRPGRTDRLIDVNDIGCRLLGYSREELLKVSLLDLIAPEDHGRIPWLHIPPQPGDTFRYETTYLTRDARRLPVEANCRVFDLHDRRVLLTVARDISERRIAEEKLRKSEERFSKAFHGNPDMVAIVRLSDHRFLDVNDGFLTATGYDRSEVVGARPEDVSLWIDPHAEVEIDHRLRTEGHIRNAEMPYRVRTGQRRLALVSGDTLQIEREPCALIVGHDITARKQMEDLLFEEKERAQVTLQSIGDAVITTDAAGRVEYLNPVAEQLTAWPFEEAKGLPLEQIFNVVSEDTRKPLENSVRRCLVQGATIRLHDHPLLIARNLRETPVDDSAAPILDREGNILGAVLVFRDVSTARKMTYQLSWQASHDALTGLFNRAEFERRVSRAIARAWETGEQHALLYLDLDQFKVVNDTSGHVAGDELLKQLSGRIQQVMRDSDTLARLGGDEFGVLLEYCPLDQAQRIGEHLRETVGDFRFTWHERIFRVGVSIGLVPITQDSGPITNVMSAADMACYMAKERGRNRVHVYKESETGLRKRHGEMQWVTRLSHAMEDKRLQLFRQDIVALNADTERVEHYEVLLRLLDEKGRLVTPAAFLPAAARYGLMPTIDRWVIQTLLERLGDQFREAWDACLARHGRCDYMRAINLSGATLNDDTFTDFVRGQLLQSRVPPGMICFEITETEAIANLRRAARLMAELRALGCRFALDDFGSGVSSFAYLKNLPVDFLKIDGAFVRNMLSDPVDRAMVESINHVGHVMHVRTIAEYVENDEILHSLEAMHVDYAQGYGISRPRLLLA